MWHTINLPQPHFNIYELHSFYQDALSHKCKLLTSLSTIWPRVPPSLLSLYSKGQLYLIAAWCVNQHGWHNQQWVLTLSAPLRVNGPSSRQILKTKHNLRGSNQKFGFVFCQPLVEWLLVKLFFLKLKSNMPDLGSAVSCVCTWMLSKTWTWH